MKKDTCTGNLFEFLFTHQAVVELQGRRLVVGDPEAGAFITTFMSCGTSQQDSVPGQLGMRTWIRDDRPSGCTRRSGCYNHIVVDYDLAEGAMDYDLFGLWRHLLVSITPHSMAIYHDAAVVSQTELAPPL